MVVPTRTGLIVALLIASTGLAASANGALLSAYDLVGEDPAGDSHNYSAPGVDSGQFATTRTDIQSLEMANDGDKVQFKLNIAALPSGTGGYQYAVHFTVAETSYFVCWNQQWTGNQAGATQQNMNGCTFAGGTRVGPTTTGDSLEAGTANDQAFVRWEVAKADIDEPSGDNPITAVYADTWFRGLNPSADGCPNTSQNRCTWLQSDRGPDAGEWSYSLTPAAPPLSLSFSMEPKNASIAPGGSGDVALMPNLTGNGSVAFNWSVEGMPDGWNASFEPQNGTLTSGANETHQLTITAPDDATNETLNLTVLLTAEHNLTASANLTIIVDTGLAPPITSSPGGSANTTTSSAANETAGPAEGGGIPAPGFLVVIGVALVAVVAARRRL